MRSSIASLILAATVIACGAQPSDEPADETAQEVTAPVAGAFAKPAGFVIVPPWAAGVSHSILQTYGTGLHVNTNSTSRSNDYYALDLGLAANEAVYPIAPGTVIYAGAATGGWSGYGNIVVLNHVVGGVNFQSLYAHLTSVAVASGSVSTSTLIGRAGNTGTMQVHLHLAIYRAANFQNAAAGKGPYGGNAVVPEAFSSCTRNGGSCENLAVGNVLVKTSAPPPPPPCGAPCTQCVLGLRSDILPFYQQNGWDTSCGNRNAIVTNWCGIDPGGCNAVKTGSACRSSCGL